MEFESLYNELLSNYKRIFEISKITNLGDPFSYNRSREIIMSLTFGHKIADTYSGADAIDNDGECEYKSTIGKSINGTYNGISVQDSLENQIEYIKNEKIGKYNNHYFARFNGADIVEAWTMKSEKVLEILMPKIVKDYNRKSSTKTKDPRIGVTITKKEIYTYGTRMI